MLQNSAHLHEFNFAFLQHAKRITRSTDTDEHHVSSRIPDDPGNLDEVDDRVREEDQVHVGASDDVVVLVQEVFQSLLQRFERFDGFVNFWQLHVRVFNLNQTNVRIIFLPQTGAGVEPLHTKATRRPFIN